MEEDGNSKWKPIKEFFGKTVEEALGNAEKELYASVPEYIRPAISSSMIPITVVTNTRDNVPIEITTSVDDKGQVFSSCIGCAMTCSGVPCRVSLTITNSIIALFGAKSFRIKFLRFKDKPALDTYLRECITKQMSGSLFVLLDKENEVPTSTLFKGFEEGIHPIEMDSPPKGVPAYGKLSVIHDVTFQTKDRYGNDITATFEQCKTVTDAAGDEVLHTKDVVPSKIQYLKTGHPDSHWMSLDFIEHMKKKMPGVVIENYEDAVRGGQFP